VIPLRDARATDCDQTDFALVTGSETRLALIVVEHGSRRVHLAGITDHPSGVDRPSSPQPDDGPGWQDRAGEVPAA
jgi:hypothetical protein